MLGEWLVILLLLGGFLYFILDVSFSKLLWEFFTLFCTLLGLVGMGFFFGIGIHLANIIFHW